MSKYSHLKEDVLKYYKETRETSDKIAQKFAQHVDNVAAFGRTIRKWIADSDIDLELSAPKILIFDIETAPAAYYAFSKWQSPLSDHMMIHDWFIISWSAKWLFEEKIMSDVNTPKEMLAKDDKRVTESLWKLLDEADIVIAHNLKAFDKKKAQTRFLKYGMPLPSQYLEIDTLLAARKEFKLNSNTLDAIAGFFGVEGKLSTPKGLWMDCMAGDKEALKMMVEYCDQDVKVLEDVYLRLRPYIKNHPNLGLFIESEDPLCKVCGHDEFEEDGFYRTTANIYEALKCKSCGAQHRHRKAVTNKTMKHRLLR